MSISQPKECFFATGKFDERSFAPIRKMLHKVAKALPAQTERLSKQDLIRVCSRICPSEKGTHF